MSRLPHGGLIDRARPLSFQFDGKTYRGFAGDTLASALLANDVALVARSFKYHRPRGVLSAGPEEPNALVGVGEGARATPNTKATTVPLSEGLRAKSQNRWPSLGFDLMAVNQLAAPLLAAGFYYKTFMWPAALWERLYEPAIRRAAGLGSLSGAPDPAIYDRSHAFCDLLVIGAGPAGLAAALTAGRAGVRVIIADTDTALGGRLLSTREAVDGMPAPDWAAAAAAELDAMANVTVLRQTSVFGVYDGREYGAVQHLPGGDRGPEQRYWKIIAAQSLLATGAVERPLVFGGNDRPGVMLSSALVTYARRFAVSAGKRVVLFGVSDSVWSDAAELIDAGVQVIAVVDPRPEAELPDIAEALRDRLEIIASAAVVDVRGRRVKALDIRHGCGQRRRLKADVLGVAGGWSPAIGLASALGAKPKWRDDLQAFVAETCPPGMATAGAAAGRLSLHDTLCDGAREGARVAKAAGRSPAPQTFVARDEPVGVGALWRPDGHRGKAFVDLQHDVTLDDIDLAVREGFRSVEHLKRYTTLGMATDQGRTSSVNGLGLLAGATGRSIPETGSVLARAPVEPISLGAIAGHHRGTDFRPTRRTAAHAWASANGATFIDAGLWKRPQWFARPGERDWIETVNREVVATRMQVGVCDVSTLGKFEVHGPDAGALLDRLYINTFSTLAIGKARYGVMLREDGFVLDDGTVTRLGDQHFYVTTTTANAGRVMQQVEFARQVLWPDLDAQAISVTEQWTTYAVAGPHSRVLLARVFPDADLGNEALPYMGATVRRYRGAEARLCRLSFSGELAYELSVPAHMGELLINDLFRLGEELGVTPYGLEALSVMRIEKGHPALGELNGQTTARDLGLGKLASKKKDYIGRAMAARPALMDPNRAALVGLRPGNTSARFWAGAHLLPAGAAATAANDQGHITSVAYSPTLGHWIGLGLLNGGAARHGDLVTAHDPVRGYRVDLEVCSPVFYDPEGHRVRS